jgi:formylmethanofuran dehydrogenase subunit C
VNGDFDAPAGFTVEEGTLVSFGQKADYVDERANQWI